jgi:hypothetical protein
VDGSQKPAATNRGITESSPVPAESKFLYIVAILWLSRRRPPESADAVKGSRLMGFPSRGPFLLYSVISREIAAKASLNSEQALQNWGELTAIPDVKKMEWTRTKSAKELKPHYER